ncbi:hypothetical protein [Dyella acidisoli]|uniref:Uncharacterized protein n=1 Tax=Dyella acidisoli TaxID=1867834 RepID=A0ABQ5XW26_9GAMM|nr:hypothetical protein [Dyella acidisoli]GLQ95153.1 hypothetical protein GCM10007901_41080 [Dyella acidisoli]
MSYKQPPLNRGVNPMKMNWLWRLICEVGYVAVDDVVAALERADIQVNYERAQGWLKAEGEDGYFPLTIAELEQNLRALQSVRSISLQSE